MLGAAALVHALTDSGSEEEMAKMMFWACPSTLTKRIVVHTIPKYHRYQVLRVRSHWALVMQLALAGITKNGYSTHSLAKFSTHFCIANTNAIAKSSVWMELDALLYNSLFLRDFLPWSPCNNTGRIQIKVLTTLPMTISSSLLEFRGF